MLPSGCGGYSDLQPIFLLINAGLVLSDTGNVGGRRFTMVSALWGLLWPKKTGPLKFTTVSVLSLHPAINQCRGI